jgi:hypothetical protein
MGANMARFWWIFIGICALTVVIEHSPARAFDTCVEAPHNVVGISALRKATRSSCNPVDAQRDAENQAAQLVVNALGATCVSRISINTARQLCAARGLKSILDASASGGDTFSLHSLAAAGQPPVTFSLQIPLPSAPAVTSGRCVALRDVNSAISFSQNYACLLETFQQTNITWRMRGFCGVICSP